MRNVVDVIDSISSELAAGQEAMDPADKIEFPDITVVVSKVDSNHLQQSSISTSQGAIVMPDPKDVFGDKHVDCLSIKVIYILNGCSISIYNGNSEATYYIIKVLDCMVMFFIITFINSY